jgi:hypothetical protein
MKSAKSKSSDASVLHPVWCHHCCIRIAPYALRTVFHGKDYHRVCFAKLANTNSKFGKT